jgi:hypothetical protein
MMLVLIYARLHLFAKTSLTTKQNQESNLSLVGGFVHNQTLMVELVLHTLTHRQMKNLDMLVLLIAKE